MVLFWWKLKYLLGIYFAFNISERQIKRQYRLAVRTVLKGHKGQSLHYMGIMTVLQSVRHFYQRYSHRSWLNVQMLARIIMQTMDPCRMLPPLEIPEDNFQCESGQSEKYQHALVVAHCNFSRAS